MRTTLCMLTAAAGLLVGCGQRDTSETVNLAAEDDAALVARAGAPLFDGMGDYHRAITTNDPGAQRYFNQGMVMAFGFNHAEAIRAFRAAQRLDDQCAMCFWGEALATGPNINVTSKGKVVMSPEERVAAFAAIQQAIARKANASEVERDLIDALATRYNGNPDTDREPLDLAWARAMGEVVARYPGDEGIEDELHKRSSRVKFLEPTELRESIDNNKYFNVVLLGVLSEHIDLPEKSWRQAIEKRVPAGSFDGNWKAFQTGKQYA